MKRNGFSFVFFVICLSVGKLSEIVLKVKVFQNKLDDKFQRSTNQAKIHWPEDYSNEVRMQTVLTAVHAKVTAEIETGTAKEKDQGWIMSVVEESAMVCRELLKVFVFLDATMTVMPTKSTVGFHLRKSNKV